MEFLNIEAYKIMWYLKWCTVTNGSPDGIVLPTNIQVVSKLWLLFSLIHCMGCYFMFRLWNIFSVHNYYYFYFFLKKWKCSLSKITLLYLKRFQVPTFAGFGHCYLMIKYFFNKNIKPPLTLLYSQVTECKYTRKNLFVFIPPFLWTRGTKQQRI